MAYQSFFSGSQAPAVPTKSGGYTSFFGAPTIQGPSQAQLAQSRLANSINNMQSLKPEDQVRLINQGIKAGIVDRTKGSQAVMQALNSRQPVKVKLNPFEKAVNFGAGLGKSLYQSTVQPVVNKTESQVKYLSGPTSTQSQRDQIMNNQKTAAQNPAYQKLIKGYANKGIGVSDIVKAQQMASNGTKTSDIKAFLDKSAKNYATNEKRGLGTALSVASLAVGGGELAGVRSIAGATKAILPTTIAGGVGGGGGTLAVNPNASGKDISKNVAFGATGGAVLPFVGAAVAKGAGRLGEALGNARKPTIGEVPVPPSAFDNHIAPTAEELPKAGQSTATATKTAQSGLKTAGADVERPVLEQPAGTIKNPNIPAANPANSIPKPSRFKNLISISGELSRQGKSGQEIADRLGKAESTSEIGQAAFLKKLPSVTNLKGKNFSNFVDTLDTLSKNEGKPAEQTILNSLDSKTKQAVDEWSKAIPSVRKQAEAAGVDVGDLGKYYFPKNYTELLSTRKGLAQAAEHLVKTGQAKNLGDAVGKLRFMKAEYSQPFGHFERSRTLDLPNYDKSRNALVNYVNGAYNKIGHAEQFGPKGEVANTLIGNIGAEGHDADRALTNYQKAIGQFKYHNPGVDTALSKVRGYNRVTKLGLSSILNATQSVNTAAVAGGARTALAALKQLSKADREYIETTGVRVDSVVNALREQAGAASKLAKGANKFQRGLSKILNAPGFGQVEKFNRGVAAVAGRDWANSLAAKGSPRALNILRNKLGIEGEIGKVLTPEQQIQAGRKIVELTQFKTGAKDLPQWADSPMGKTVVQFRTFSYKQTGFAYNELIKEAVKGNPLPLMRFIAIGTPVGILAGGARNVLGGKPFYGDTKGQSATKKVLGATYAGSSNVGGTGLAGSALFLAQNRKSPNLPSYIAGDVGGPTVGLGASIVQSYGNKTARERLALGQVPVAGPYLKTKFTPYGSDQTQAFNKAAPEGVAKTLVQLKYQPGDPSDTRSTQLKTSDPKKYKQFLNDSNKLFVDAINRAQADPKFNSKNATDKKNTLSHQLSLARQKALDDMHIPKPKKVKRTKEPSYVR